MERIISKVHQTRNHLSYAVTHYDCLYDAPSYTFYYFGVSITLRCTIFCTRNRLNETNTEQYFNHSYITHMSSKAYLGINIYGRYGCFKNKLFSMQEPHAPKSQKLQNSCTRSNEHNHFFRQYRFDLIFVTFQKGIICPKSRHLFIHITLSTNK